ncbi:MAG: hypothetical protein ABI395_05690 [Sphingobium sp.]
MRHEVLRAGGSATGPDARRAFIPAPPVDVRPNILIVDDRKENLLATERVLKSLIA